MAEFSGKKCSSPGCGKDAIFRCPQCVELEIITKSCFCSQICFNNNWKEHKQQHIAKIPCQIYVHDDEAIHRWTVRAHGDISPGAFEINKFVARTTPDSNKDEVELSFYCRMRQCIVDCHPPKIYVDEEFYTQVVLDRTFEAPSWNEFKASSVRNLSIDCGLMLGFVSRDATLYTEETILQQQQCDNTPILMCGADDPDAWVNDRHIAESIDRKSGNKKKKRTGK
jgi:hypothetical protein